MSSREEQMSLKMELEPRSASLVPTMVVTVVGREESWWIQTGESPSSQLVDYSQCVWLPENTILVMLKRGE